MRPAEYTLEEIIAAGETLLDTGRNVTGFALRQRVGGGNPTRLKQVWEEHLASKRVAEVEPVAELPIEVAEEVAAVSRALTEHIAALAVELNDKADKAAERRVAEVVRAAGQQREQAERELADAAQTVDELEAQLDQLRAERETLQQRLAETRAESQKQAVELAQLRERLTAAEKAAQTEAEKHTAELQKVGAQVDQARDELKRAASAAEDLRAELVTVKADVHAAEKAAKAEAERHAAELGKAEALIEKERANHQQALDQVRHELKQTASIAEGLRADLASVKAAADAAEESHQEHRKEAAKEAQRCADKVLAAEKARDGLVKEAAAARENVARLAGQLEALQAQNAKLIEAIGGKGAGRA